MRSFDFVFKAPNYGRSISDDKWETIDLAYVKLWKQALSLLSRHEVSAKGRDLVIEADWTPILRRHKRHYAAMQHLARGNHGSLEETYKTAGFPRRAAMNRFIVKVRSSKDPYADRNLARHVVECFVYDVFLIMNLAAPGSCDFYRASLRANDDEWDISASNVSFEGGLLTTFDGGWPPIKPLDLPAVVSWFRSVRSGTAQVPRNAMERALFALLQISHTETSPMTIIWLFYAFESLLHTVSGENFSAIVRRLSLLLDTNDEQTKLIKKGMRGLYDIRSSIVHGGFQIIHPSHNEVLDENVDEIFGRILDATHFGIALLLSIIQKAIERNWTSLKFKEIFQNEPK